MLTDALLIYYIVVIMIDKFIVKTLFCVSHKLIIEISELSVDSWLSSEWAL